MTAARNDKPVPSAHSKKHVSFCTPEDSPESAGNNRSRDDNGLLLHVKGHGQLCIKSASASGNKNDVDINILVNIHSDKVPVTLFLPYEQANGQLEITGDGDIQFAVKESSDVKQNQSPGVHCMPKSELNDLNKECMVVDTGQNNDFKKTHRRSNSDFLQVSGKDEHSDTESIDNVPDGDSSAKCMNTECALTKDTQRNISGSLETDHSNHSANNSVSTNQVDPRARANSETEDSGGKVCGEHEKDKEEVYKHKHSSENKNKSGQTCLSRTFSFSRSLSEFGNCRLSLREAIRQSFTYLLDVLDLLDLCDHLYEKYILDMDVYQKLFHMCFDPRHIRDAKRSLLLHLSTRTVQRDKLIDALYGSAQYQLVPCFYPDVKI